jgi:hypothetical protein
MGCYQTIQVSSCVSVQGDFVELLANGDVLVRDGRHVYRGRPVASAVPEPLARDTRAPKDETS